MRLLPRSGQIAIRSLVGQQVRGPSPGSIEIGKPGSRFPRGHPCMPSLLARFGPKAKPATLEWRVSALPSPLPIPRNFVSVVRDRGIVVAARNLIVPEQVGFDVKWPWRRQCGRLPIGNPSSPTTDQPTRMVTAQPGFVTMTGQVARFARSAGRAGGVQISSDGRRGGTPEQLGPHPRQPSTKRLAIRCGFDLDQT